MNQFGPIFREARTESGKSIEDAVKETKIAKKYLLAIENENFDVFPGETYLLGFLRNYAQFLGLDPDEMVLKYRDYKIQEQPAPIEQLTAKPKTTRKYLLIILTILLIVSSVLYVVFSGRKQEKEIAEEKAAEQEERQAKEPENIIVFEEEEVIKDFKKGDKIEIPMADGVHRISIDGINDNLEFSIGEIPFCLSTDERVEIDFNRDGRKDILLRTNRLGEGSVNLTIKKLYKTEISDTGLKLAYENTEGGEGAPLLHKGISGGKKITPEVVIIKEDDLLDKIPIAPKTGFQIVSSYEKTDIVSSVKAVQTAYFGYIIDEGEKEEALLKNGEEIAITAKDVLRIMVANAKGITMQINEIPISLGEKGLIVAKVIRWYRDSENSDLYHLIIDDWEK